MLADEADNLVIFLGAGANADDRDGPFRPGASMLPDDADIAEYLAVKARLKSSERQLAEVAQYARMIRGEPRVFSWVKSILATSAPGPVHRYLARLPRRLEELGLEKRYQMIVTSKFDVALEQAFLDAKEPFDVAIYMAPGTEHAGRFVHVKWGDAVPQPVSGAERVRRLPHRRRRQPADQDGHRQDQRCDRRRRHRLPVEEQLRDHRGSLHRLLRWPPGRGSRAHADPGQAAPVELPVPRLRPGRLAAPGLPALDLAG